MSHPKELDFESKVGFLRGDHGFAGLDEAGLRELAAMATRCSFPKGKFIFYSGNATDSFYIVEKGRVNLFKETPKGNLFLVAIATRGHTLNSVVCYTNRPRQLSAQAMEKATLLRIPRAGFVDFVSKHPQVITNVVGILGEALDNLYTRLADLAGERVDQRLINILKMLANQFGTTLPLTQQELAETLATTRETTARIIGRLKDMGIVANNRGHIIILDVPGLNGLSTCPPDSRLSIKI